MLIFPTSCVFPVSQSYFDNFWFIWAFFWILYVIPFFGRICIVFFDILDVFVFDLGTNTHQTYRLLPVFRSFRLFHSSFLKTRAREELFSTGNNVSKSGVTSKKTGITSKSLDVIREKLVKFRRYSFRRYSSDVTPAPRFDHWRQILT